ncbi:MAG: formate C-acetyltransferase [Alphaproteobacteria bacterium]|nr:formate C-acetyltransferase [Alphaproteobacteria bacterium]
MLHFAQIDAKLTENFSFDEYDALSPEWRGFSRGSWCESIDVRDFILRNYTPFDGDGRFLAGPNDGTVRLWDKVKQLLQQERDAGGVLDADISVPSDLLSHAAGYIDRELETIVGLQTEAPLKRAIMPTGGVNMVIAGLNAYGKDIDPETAKTFTRYRKSHNQGVFDAYTPDIRAARKSGIVTGLPDAYGRGRIIGDYRRVALYGVDALIRAKKAEKAELDNRPLDEVNIRLREELSEQLRALADLKEMAGLYGADISGPATTAQQAVQAVYFGYLGAVKEQNGAAMSLGRVSSFLDIYFERDMQAGRLAEAEAQALIDQFVIKLRLVRFLRTPEYDQLFSGDPTWVTETIGGMTLDGRPLVTKTSFRFLQTLRNLGPSPEPNLTVMWSDRLPAAFKAFCAEISIETSAIQFENDEVMRPYWGDDYGIACCVSPMRIGKQMQFFGARANLAKALLYALNGGKDEISGAQVGPATAPITGDYLDYDEVMSRFSVMTDWLARTYVNALNIIHFMHDKYCYERLEMALHDRDVVRTLACGVAGLSVTADSLAAIKYGKVRIVRDARGLITDFVNEVPEDELPRYGNNDDRVDGIAVELVDIFMEKLRRIPAYRDAIHTQSVLTITSNVVYGKKTGSTPDGRKAGEPFAPGANPMHGRDRKGALASMASVGKIDYNSAQDGISYTFSIVPGALGRTGGERIANLSGLLDAYFAANDTGGGAQHINVNVLDRETLIDAMEHPETYPQLTIRVSGYAVNFIKLTREQQLDVINRTFHDRA